MDRHRTTCSLKTQLGFGWNGLRIYPESGNTTLSQVQDIGTGSIQRNYLRDLVDDRYRLSLHSTATYFMDRFGKHEIKGGLRYKYTTNPSEEYSIGDVLYKTQFGQPYSRTRYFLDFDDKTQCDISRAGYDPTRCTQGTLEKQTTGNRLILFAEDAWKLPRFKRLTVIPGAALHVANTTNPEGYTVTSFVTGTLHLNFALDLLNDGKTVIRGGYNQYVDMGFLSVADFIGKDFITQECDYNADTGDYSSNCRIGGQTRTVGRPDGPDYDADGKVIEDSKFNPDLLDPPRTHEWNLGAEHQWFEGFSTGVDFTWRQYSNQWEDLETNVIWNQLGDGAQAFKNGKSEFIFDLETPEEAYRRYVGLTFTARRTVGNWQVIGSYTWSRFEGTVSEGFATQYLDNARQANMFNGFLPDDRRHAFKLSGWYRTPWDLTLGGSMWIGSGTPYDRLYFNSFYNDYNDRRAPRGVNPNDLSTPDDDEELRTPTRLALDLKLNYKLERLTRWVLGEPMKLELIGEIFNLFNLRTATRYEDRNLKPGASTQWGDIIDRQAAFNVRFGLRYRY